MEVRVRVAGLYNGAGHKSLGWHEPGDVVDIPRGPYLDSLFQDGLVEPVGVEDGPVEAKSDPGLWDLLHQRRVHQRVIRALMEAGYHSLDAIQAASDEELLALPGVGPAAVRTLRELGGEA